MKQIVLTITITFALLGIIIGGIIFFVVKTASPKGKEGQCQWQSKNSQYQNLSCQAFVNKENIVTINLKGKAAKDILLTSVSFLKCSNKNNYFMCAGLRQFCSVINQKGPDFQAKCQPPWGPIEVKANFDVGIAMIRWKK